LPPSPAFADFAADIFNHEIHEIHKNIFALCNLKSSEAWSRQGTKAAEDF